MIYFSNAPVVPDSIDQTQYAAMVEFRESLKSRGLVSFFDDASTFRVDLFRHLSQTVIRDFAANETDGEFRLPASREEPEISDPSRELLFAAVADSAGRIMYVRYLGGMEISTGGRNFIDDHSPRTAAKWEGAIDELEQLGFIVARGTKREVFSVTEQGYAFAESHGVVPPS